MNSKFINSVINSKCGNADIIVLKGFSPRLILELGEDYHLIDRFVYKDECVCLDLMNSSALMMEILKASANNPSICCVESFIDLSTQITGLSILNKKIIVLNNNMLELYPNPANIDIPDFDSNDFQNTEKENELYSKFYSYCVLEEGIQYIQYIDNYSIDNDCVQVVDIVDEKDVIVKEEDSESGVIILSAKDGSVAKELAYLYEHLDTKEKQYGIHLEELSEELIKVFVNATKTFGLNIEFFKAKDSVFLSPRPELYDIMQRVWGYSSFRNLKIYKNPSINNDVVEVSQGSIIELVIEQSEKAYSNNTKLINNLLLTSPTGSGKSLLFQLSAIYLAEKYELLTIVVSPLVALMEDQVKGLAKYDGIATLNSGKTAAQKDEILTGIKDKTISILYLSPELLLSYSIKTFIGDRRLGLLVIDEAHTVTTWGRDFRVDYWFLGDYLRQVKRILQYTFPIFALTATAVWDPSGRNDMVFDTIRSLNMNPCVKYIGLVKRENISFDIQLSYITRNYEEKRNALTISRIIEAISNRTKTLVYFPFKRTIASVLYSQDFKNYSQYVTQYHSGLSPEEKKLNASDFASGSKPIMCATKAFGMGIDVSDIAEVYHHAPTGCLSDYVQEIGRLARDPQINGVAKIDFSEKDFKYIRTLHGLSTIRHYQLREVLKKLMMLYRFNGEKRNMLITANDFSYIFPMSTIDEYDQKLKSCLLLLSNDLLNKLRFHAIIVRPKSLFSKCFIKLPISQSKDFHRKYIKYLKKVEDGVFILNADAIWNERFSNFSFADFKYRIASNKIFDGYDVEMINKVELSFHQNSLKIAEKQLIEFFDISHKLLDDMATKHHRLEINQIKANLPNSYDRLKREQFVEAFRMLYATDKSLGGHIAAYCKVMVFDRGGKDEREMIQLNQSGYEVVKSLYLSVFQRRIVETRMIEYCSQNDELVKLSELLSVLGISDYQRSGGDSPSIFVRINNPYYLNNLVRTNNYQNEILESIYEKYLYSERVFSYFFTTKMTDKQRWNFIEAYFLGASEESLLHFVE